MAAIADPVGSQSQLSPRRRLQAAPSMANDVAMPSDAAIPVHDARSDNPTLKPAATSFRGDAARYRTLSGPVRTWNQHQRLINGATNGSDDRCQDDIGRRPTPTLHDDTEDGRRSPDAQNKALHKSPTLIHQTKQRRGSVSASTVQKLPASEMQELMSSPQSLPIGPAPPSSPLVTRPSFDHGKFSQQKEAIRRSLLAQPELRTAPGGHSISSHYHHQHTSQPSRLGASHARGAEISRPSRKEISRSASTRTVSTPPTGRSRTFEPPSSLAAASRSVTQPQRPLPPNLHFDDAVSSGRHICGMPPSSAMMNNNTVTTSSSTITATVVSAGLEVNGPSTSRAPSPLPTMIPLPPMSLPTHLQLELATERPSPLYIHRSPATDIPYESSAIKFERLRNVILLPPYLERTLYFGALACLDAWLHTFTILPIRFVMAVSVLVRWWMYVLCKETKWLCGFVWDGMGRLWQRIWTNRGRKARKTTSDDRSRSTGRAGEANIGIGADAQPSAQNGTAGRRHASTQHTDAAPGPKSNFHHHRRTKSMPSTLSSYQKADLLQGAVILCSSFALMTLDASRMYHFVRAQSAIKLYVIFNILEVGDRLLSAIGQDIFECLFSSETLSRNASGRSKILLPAGMFVLALGYNCLHSIALYYQVITLNVAVNSYSNALLTLLLSNQFVEIKSTVFKRFEKDNLFQLTCADIVERFHLWIMLLIIAMRNIVEVGGLSVPGAGIGETEVDGSGTGVPLHHPSILPYSFTALPSWLWSGEVLSPFFIVIGSEMLVDTIKHAYVTKFNNIKPHFYSRTLDILCKDYYTHAFTSPSLTRRLGLAVIPLSCLFIRASVQTYHMFLATYLPMPILQPTTQTSLMEESARPSSPAMMAALNRFDALIRDSLGRATYGYPYDSPLNARSWYAWTSDDCIAALTMVVVFFIAFLVLLILKLLLGMALLHYARGRYAKMKHKEQLIALGTAEHESYDAKGRRIGGRGDVEVSDDGQRWIHADKSEGLRGGKGPGGRRAAADEKKAEPDYHGVFRYDMVNKRIW